MDATYISSNQFSVSGDRSLEFIPNRRLKINLAGDGIIYDSVSTSSYSVPDTIVTTTESGLTANLTDVLYGIVEPGISGSLPNHNHDGSEGSGGVVTDTYLVGGSELGSTLNLYISVSGSDTTGDGSLENPYATFSGPVNYFRTMQIAPATYIYINFLDGVHTLNSLSINTTHLPYHDRMYIYGTTVLLRNITSVQSSSGSAGGYSVIYNLDDVSNMNVGEYVLVNDNATGGTNPKYACGVHEITNVDAVNSRITVLSTHRKGSPSGAVTATIEVFKTIINQYSTSNGISAQFGKHLKIGGFVLVGGTSGTGIVSADGGSIVRDSSSFPVGISGFATGAYAARNGFLDISQCGASGANGYGVYVQETATMRGSNLVVSGSNSHGIVSLYSGQFQGNNSVSTGHNGIGYYAIYTSYIHVSPSHSTGNVGVGWYANYNSVIRRTGTCTGGNNSSDTGTTNGSYIQTA